MTQRTCGSSGCSCASDGAVDNEPNMLTGPCDCSVEVKIQVKGKADLRVSPVDIKVAIFLAEI